MSERIRFGTNIITFFNTEYWGLPGDLSHPQWVSAFNDKPHHYFERMFDGVRDAGLEGVELAPDPGGWEAALAAYGSTDALKQALSERGLVLSSSYSAGRQLIGNALMDPAAEAVADDNMARHARFLVEMGADIITIGNIARGRFGNESPDETATAEDFSAPVPRELHERFADQLNRLGGIIGAYGVRMAIHTDAYSVCSRNEDITTVMSLTDPTTVQLCPDAGHITLDGGDAVEVLRTHIDRIPTMHWKDCAVPLSAHLLRGNQKERHAVMLTHFRILGSGMVNWKEWMEVLRDKQWSGWATEEIDMSPDPVGELREGLEYFRTELAGIYR
ncbi:MAG TPA: sugar phosphate isomerase/epimerase [Terrimesophilobacter sp.]|uniref:sugar phosphate isomerase/epimerase family protein n=1 Tax=Terrimesophilobacter sp. TaxID=2906435 RepID=UPI002F936CF5